MTLSLKANNTAKILKLKKEKAAVAIMETKADTKQAEANTMYSEAQPLIRQVCCYIQTRASSVICPGVITRLFCLQAQILKKKLDKTVETTDKWEKVRLVPRRSRVHHYMQISRASIALW